MDIKPILDAARGVELALSKFTTVLQDANDNNIFAVNDACTTETFADVAKQYHTEVPVTPSTPVAPALDIASVTVTELDDEGIPHDPRIHSAKPSLVNSKEVKGGKAWRRQKGLDDATYDTIKAELKAQYVSATPAPVSVAVLDEPVPTAPSIPAAPSAPSAPAPSIPSAPAAPLAPVVNTDENAELRKECIGIIKQLTETHGLTFEDCKEVLVEEFKVAQNGDEITFGSIKISQYEAVRDYFLALRTEYETAENYVTEIRELAGAANAGLIDEGLLQILSAYNTAEIGGVHYASVKALNETLAGWHKTYVDWKAGQ